MPQRSFCRDPFSSKYASPSACMPISTISIFLATSTSAFTRLPYIFSAMSDSSATLICSTTFMSIVYQTNDLLSRGFTPDFTDGRMKPFVKRNKGSVKDLRYEAVDCLPGSGATLVCCIIPERHVVDFQVGERVNNNFDALIGSQCIFTT